MTWRKPTTILKTAFDDALGQRLRDHLQGEAGDAGLKSLHGPLIEMALGGPPPPGGGARAPADARVTDRVLVAAAEHRRMRQALAKLSQAQRGVLWAAYGPDASWPPEVCARFQTLGLCCGVALGSAAATMLFSAEVERRFQQVAGRREGVMRVEAFQRRGVGEWLRSSAPDEVVAVVVAEAEQLLRDAREAFRDALHAPVSHTTRASASSASRERKPRVEPLELRKRTLGLAR